MDPETDTDTRATGTATTGHHAAHDAPLQAPPPPPSQTTLAAAALDLNTDTRREQDQAQGASTRPNSVALPPHPAAATAPATAPAPAPASAAASGSGPGPTVPPPRFNLPLAPPRDPHLAAQAAALTEATSHDQSTSNTSAENEINAPLPATHPADHPTRSDSPTTDPGAPGPSSSSSAHPGTPRRHHNHGWTAHRRRSRSSRAAGASSRRSPLSDGEAQDDDDNVLHGDHIPDRAWLAQHLDLAQASHSAANDGLGILVDRVVSAQLLEHHAVIMHQLLHRCRHPDPATDALYLIRAENRYVKWLFMLERLRAVGDEGLVPAGRIVPPLDVVLMWLAHFTAVRHYVEDVSRLFDDSLLYLSPPLARIRQLLDADPFGYHDTASVRMWESFTGEDWQLRFDDTSPFVLSCPTCTGDVPVEPADYLRLKLEQGFRGLSCQLCGTVLTASFLSAVRFVNDFKGSLREPNTYVAGTLLNPVSGKPNHYLSKQIVQYLSQAPSVADLYAAVVVPVPSPPHSPVLAPQQSVPEPPPPPPAPAAAAAPDYSPAASAAAADVVPPPLPPMPANEQEAPLAPTPIRPGSSVTVLAPSTPHQASSEPTSPTPRTNSAMPSAPAAPTPRRRSTDSARSAEARRQQQELEFVYALSHSLVQRGGTMTRTAPQHTSSLTTSSSHHHHHDAPAAAGPSSGGPASMGGLGMAMAAAADAREQQQQHPARHSTTSSNRHQQRRSSFSFWTHTSSPKPAKQSLDPWRDIANVLFRLEVDLYALELEDHRLISWHIRAAIDRMERGYRNLVTPLSLDLIARVRGHWRTTAALIVAWLTYAGAKAPPAPLDPSLDVRNGRPASVHSTSGSDNDAPAAGPTEPAATATAGDQDSEPAAVNHHPANAVMAMLPAGMVGIPGLPSAPASSSAASSMMTDAASLRSSSTFTRKRKPAGAAAAARAADRLSVLVTPAAGSSSSSSHTAAAAAPRSSPLSRTSPPGTSSPSGARNPRAAANHPLPAPIALEVAGMAAMANDPPPAMYKLTRSKSATAKLGVAAAAPARRARTISTPAESMPDLHVSSSSTGSLDTIALDPAAAAAPPVPRLPAYVHPPSDAAGQGDDGVAPIPSLVAVVDTHVLALSTVRYHKFLLLQRAHAGLYSARMALPIDLVLANWTHLLYPPRYVRFSAAYFGRLVTYEFATVQALDAALRNTARKWRRRYGEHVDVGYRPKLSWGDKIAAVVDRFVGRLVSAAPL